MKMIKMNKKAASNVQDLYPFVILLVLLAMVVGIGLITIHEFSTAPGLNESTAAAINKTTESLESIPNTWLPLIVVITVLAIIMSIVMKGFGGGGR